MPRQPPAKIGVGGGRVLLVRASTLRTLRGGGSGARAGSAALSFSDDGPPALRTLVGGCGAGDGGSGIVVLVPPDVPGIVDRSF